MTTTAAPEIIVEKVKYVKVLAAAEPLNTGQRLSERSITTIQWPAEALNANIISVEDNPDASAVFINSLARQPIGEGETLTRSKVIMAGDSGVMAALLKPGMRAVTTRISVDTAAGGFIQPGDRVDIILRENFSVPQRANNNAQGNNQSRGIQRNSIYMANILFENVKVLAIDQTFSSGPEVGASLVGSIATFRLQSHHLPQRPADIRRLAGTIGTKHADHDQTHFQTSSAECQCVPRDGQSVRTRGDTVCGRDALLLQSSGGFCGCSHSGAGAGRDIAQNRVAFL